MPQFPFVKTDGNFTILKDDGSIGVQVFALFRPADNYVPLGAGFWVQTDVYDWKLIRSAPEFPSHWAFGFLNGNTKDHLVTCYVVWGQVSPS